MGAVYCPARRASRGPLSRFAPAPLAGEPLGCGVSGRCGNHPASVPFLAWRREGGRSPPKGLEGKMYRKNIRFAPYVASPKPAHRSRRGRVPPWIDAPKAFFLSGSLRDAFFCRHKRKRPSGISYIKAKIKRINPYTGQSPAVYSPHAPRRWGAASSPG